MVEYIIQIMYYFNIYRTIGFPKRELVLYEVGWTTYEAALEYALETEKDCPGWMYVRTVKIELDNRVLVDIIKSTFPKVKINNHTGYAYYPINI